MDWKDDANLVWLKVDDIKVPDFLLRGLDPEKADVSDLVESFKVQGILQPILVRPDPEGGYELVSGWRRLHAARQVGYDEIPAYVRTLTDEQAAVAELAENIARKSLPPHREAEAVVKLLAYRLKVDEEGAVQALYRYSNAHKGNRKEIEPAEAQVIEELFSEIGRGPLAFVGRILPTLKWPEDVLRALEEGTITMRAAQRVKRIKDPELRQEAIRRIAEGENPSEAVAEVLSGAHEDRKVSRMQGVIDMIEEFDADEDGYIITPPPTSVAEPSWHDVIHRDYLVREVIAIMGWARELVTLVYPEEQDIMRAVEEGARLMWVDNERHSRHTKILGEVNLLKERTIFFAIPGKVVGSIERDGEVKNIHLDAKSIVELTKPFRVVVAPLKYAHLYGREISFVAVNDDMSALAVML